MRARPALRLMIIAIAISAIGYRLWYSLVKPSCPVQYAPYTVSGNSLEGLIRPGTMVRIANGYYKCHPVERGDIVAYRFPESAPLVKVVRAIPGDMWEIVLNTDRASYEIIVNGSPLTTSRGERYQLSEDAKRLLALYVRDFKNVIPPDSFLLLGNLPGGSFDSSAFGLAAKSDVIGKVMR